jgi:hypothetical protein
MRLYLVIAECPASFFNTRFATVAHTENNAPTGPLRGQQQQGEYLRSPIVLAKLPFLEQVEISCVCIYAPVS